MPIGMKPTPDEVLQINRYGCSGTTFDDKNYLFEKYF